MGNLLRVGVALTLHELMKPQIVDRVRQFYAYGFNKTGWLCDEEAYEEKVLSLDTSKFRASLLRLQSMGAIDSADIEALDRLYEYRKTPAHGSGSLVLNPDFKIDDDLVNVCPGCS